MRFKVGKGQFWRTLLLQLMGVLVTIGCGTTVAAPTPDIEATVSAAVKAALPTATFTPIAGLDTDIQPKVDATVANVPTVALPPTMTPLPTATLTPTYIPTPTATLVPTAAPTPTATAAPTATPLPVVAPQVMEVVSTNLGTRVRYQVYLPSESNERTIKRIVVTPPRRAPEEHIVGFIRQRGPYFLGEVYFDPMALERSTKEWIQQNVGIVVGGFPVRVACTGSMRPYIDCGDQVIYEPVFADTPLAQGDVVTFRLSDDDVNFEKDCPWLTNVPGLGSVSALVGTQRIFIIHRIVQTVGGSYPPAFITRGDNNVFEDDCVVSKPSIVFKVVGVVKDYYVIDQIGYDHYVAQYQQFLKEYWTNMARYLELRQQYEASVSTYRNLAGSGASQSTLDRMYQDLERMRQELNDLVDRVNRLPDEMALAQQRIEEAVAPFPVKMP